MIRTVMTIAKWISIPALLTAALLSGLAASYEPMVDALVCLVAIVFLQRAAWVREYYWAAGFFAIAVLLGPVSLILKIFLLMIVSCVASVAASIASFRPRPALQIANL